MKVMLLVGWTIMAVLAPVGRDLRVNPAEAAQPAQAAHNCQNVQLVIRSQNSQGAAGTIVINYRIHNVTGQACTLYGYPGVQLLDRHFLTLPTTVHRGGSVIAATSPRLIRVGPYGSAYFAIAYNDVPVGNQPCEAPAPYLMIWAPNDILPVVTYASTGGGGIMACTGNIYVSTVTTRPSF